jgi:hypothetical protein
MRIIFSRKGFDSQNGGVPSPIIKGQPMSLPIPHKNSSCTFADVGMGQIVEDLSKHLSAKRRLRGDMLCHPDPDLAMGAFGQAGAAQGHLDNEHVGKGDLFLFFGSFRDAGTNEDSLTFKKAAQEHHRIFGWLFVEEKVRINSTGTWFQDKYPAYAAHPHAIGDWPKLNTIFIAPKRAMLFDDHQVKGFGKFKATDASLLTDMRQANKSLWLVPDWLNPKAGGCGLSYHKKPDFSGKTLQTTAKGQEFVCQPAQSGAFKDWLTKLFKTAL